MSLAAQRPKPIGSLYRGRTVKLFRVFFLLSIIPAQFVGAQSTRAISQEFSSDDAFAIANAVRLPKPVLAALPASNEAVAGRGWARDNPGKDLNSLFTAFRARLSAAEEKDYVVVGKKPLTGADNVWFWVIHPFSSRPRVVLFCSALTVDLLSSEHNSNKDIRCTWESPGGDGYIEDYQFDGHRYLLARKTQTHRRP